MGLVYVPRGLPGVMAARPEVAGVLQKLALHGQAPDRATQGGQDSDR
jgi:hypothetical protein